MRFPKIKQGIWPLLLSLLASNYSASSAHKWPRQRVPTNHRLPEENQKRIIAKAEAKRQRKLARPNGWYGG